MDAEKIFNLQNKVVLLTGASGHLGLTLTEGLLNFGAKVYACSFEKKTSAALQTKFKQYKSNLVTLSFDIKSEPGIVEAVKKIRESETKIDVLINAANSPNAGDFMSLSRKDFDSSFSCNVLGPFFLIKNALGLLAKAGRKNAAGASIINISSMYGSVSPNPGNYENSKEYNPLNYGASKAAMSQMTKYLACHLGNKNIRVNTISPGAFPNLRIFKGKVKTLANLKKSCPLGRIGEPHELIGAVVFLASDASSFITGANIPVDGGWTAW